METGKAGPRAGLIFLCSVAERAKNGPKLGPKVINRKKKNRIFWQIYIQVFRVQLIFSKFLRRASPPEPPIILSDEFNLRYLYDLFLVSILAPLY